MPLANWRRALAGLIFFSVAFGFVEAAVVVYLRDLYEPMTRELAPPRAPGDLFPLIPPGRLLSAGPSYVRRLKTELAREAATLIMLAGVALAVARNWREWMAALLVVFGVWDLAFYAFLKVLIDWPTSLFTWDILFLLPVPWVGPVLSPVLVAGSMVAGGVAVLLRVWSGLPFPMRWYHWALILGGGLIDVLAFTWDFRNTMAGGYPNSFNWPLLACGEAIAIGAFLHAWRSGTR